MPLLDKISHLLLLLMVCSLPVSKGLASVSLFMLLLVSLFRASRLSFEGNARLFAENKSVALLCLLFFLYLFGLFNTENLEAGLSFVYIQNSFLAVPLIALYHKGLIQSKFFLYLKGFVAVNLLGGFVTLLLHAMPGDSVASLVGALDFLKPYQPNSQVETFGLYSPFIGRINFSNTLSIAVLSSCWLFANESVLKKAFALLAGLCLVATLLFLGGRGSQLGLLAGLAAWAAAAYLKFAFPLLRRRFNLAVSYAGLVVGLVLFLGLMPYMAYENVPAVKKRYNQMRWELNTYNNNTYTKYPYQHLTTLRRIFSWKNSWEIIKENPIFGVGVGDYKDEMQAMYDKDGLGLSVNTHNQFLHIWAGTGIAGLLLFLFILFHWFRDILGRNDRLLTVFAASVLLYYLVVLMTDSLLVNQIGGMTFAIVFCFLGLLPSRSLPNATDPPNETGRVGERMAAVV